MSQLTVVFFYMQSGATMETYDKERFLNEVALPIRGLLATPSIVESVIITTLSSTKYKHGEIFERRLVSEDGPPPHLFSPTSDAVSKNLRGPIKEGKVAFLSIEHLSEKSAIEYMVGFAFASGTRRVLVLRHGMQLPSRGVLRVLYEKMLKDGRRSLVCEHTEQLKTPA